MRRRDRPLDISRKMRIARVARDVVADEEALQKLAVVEVAVPSKKKLNIPVTDVSVREEYDNWVTPTYQMPTSYVRYNKKTSDEVDLIVDYVCEVEDEEWIATKLPQLERLGCAQYLTFDTIETAINAFERQTGTGDIVPLAQMEKVLQQALGLPPAVYPKIVPDLYQYWITKRNRLRKPCCRRFWPQTPASDSNPHMVFRPREKERYRLRKHRKNDLDSYRKLQQLRREFSHARTLLQLVIERERLKKAELEIQDNILEQAAYELSHPNAATPRVPMSELYNYQPQFLHLLVREPPTEVKTTKKRSRGANAVVQGATEGGDAATGLKLSLKLGRGGADSAAASTSADVEKKRKSMGGAGGTEQKKKRESTAGAIDDKSIAGADVVLVGDSATAVFASSVLAGNALYESNCARLAALGVPGPPTFLQPLWPGFMTDLSVRSKTSIPHSISEYADELKLRPDEPLPTRYRCRSRVGRGGRVVVDRIPIYPESEDVRDRDERLGRPALNAYDITYIYPTSLPSIHEQFRFCQAAREAREGKRTGVSAEDMLRPVAEPQSMYQGKQSSHDRGSKQAHELSRASSSTSIAYNKNYELYYSRCHPIRELGLAVPPPRLVQPSELAKRKMEIFRMPDGEDELVEVPRGIIAPHIAVNLKDTKARTIVKQISCIN